MLSGIHLLMDRWKQATGSLVANIAVVATLAAFTLRLALTQFSQQKEILHRQTSQQKLIAANHQIGALLEDARRQTVEITQISELGSLLQACASLPEVFRLLPERLRRLFPGSSGCVSLLSPSKNHLETVVSWGPCPPTGQIFAPEECWALRRGRSHKHPQGASGFRCSHLMGEGASVCLPLVGNGEAIGTIAVQNHHDIAFHPAESEAETNAFARRCQIAAAVAEHLAFSISNLNLREALRLQAVRDSLTGLYNRRYMQEFLDRELHSARRKQRPLAVLMLDLDHFKRFNDTFGHSAGDMALAAVGSALLRCIRADDIACRYGGEEFALILPECSLAQATLRAEEICKRIREISLAPNGQAADPVTVSIGVAAFDETTDRVDLLMKFADDALYRAKRAGRNRVIAARPAVGIAECESKTNQNCDNSGDSSPGPDSLAHRPSRTGGKANPASASSK